MSHVETILDTGRPTTIPGTNGECTSALESGTGMSGKIGMKVLALDLSLTATGWADNDGQGTISPKKRPSDIYGTVSTIQEIYSAVSEKVSGSDVVVIEGPSFDSLYGKAHERAGLWWRIALYVLALGIPLVVIPPSQIKKWATGKGNAKKDEVVASVVKLCVKHFPEREVINNNEADALAMWMMAAHKYGFACGGATVAREEVCNKIDWPAVNAS